jgi:hypothetical protein
MTVAQAEKHIADRKAKLSDSAERLFFAAPRDNAWVAKKSHATQFGDAKHAPHTKVKTEPVAETMEQFKANVLVDTEVEKVLSTTELGRAFLEDLKGKANHISEIRRSESEPWYDNDRDDNEPTPES